MSRKLMAVLVSSALMFGNLSTSAWSAPDTQVQVVQTADRAKNQSPLSPGGAAGITQAQAQGSVEPWAAIAIVAGIFLVVYLLIHDEDDDESTSTTGTTGT